MLTARARRHLFILGVLYAAVVIPVGIRRGGDFVQELAVSDRLIAGAVPLYTHNPVHGVFWPPFTIAALVPFALLAGVSLSLSQALWAVANVALLGWSLLRLSRRAGWRPVALAVAAVAKPLQGNFEHQNLLVVLLALIVAAIADLEEGRERRAGLWIGVATAVKLFPGLLLLYLAWQRRWRGFAIGAAVACGLTLAPSLRYGPGGGVSAVEDWVALSSSALGAVHFFGFQQLGGWVIGLGGSDGAVWLVTAVCGGLVVAATAARPTEDPLYDLGLVTVLAVLVSPIGQFFYELLAIPAWVAALTLPPPAGRAAARAWRSSLVIAGVLLSGVLTFDYLRPDGLELIYRYNYVWGALLLLGALVTYRLLLVRPSLAPA